MEWAKELLKYVNLKGIVVEWVLKQIVKPKLEQIVKDTSNPFDDSLLVFVYPLIEESAVKAVDELEKKVNA